IPQLGRLAREDGGRQKIMQLTRYITVGLCIFQGYLLALSFQHPESYHTMLPGITDTIRNLGIPLVDDLGWKFRIVTVISWPGTPQAAVSRHRPPRGARSPRRARAPGEGPRRRRAAGAFRAARRWCAAAPRRRRSGCVRTRACSRAAAGSGCWRGALGNP